MPAPVSVRDDLCRLVALSPGDGRIAGLVRQVCARALSLPSLPCEVAVNEPESPAEAVVAEFAEQFSVDVSAITGEQRSLLWTHLGEDAFGAVVAMYIADFVPRVRAGLEALGVGKEYLGWVTGPISWDHNTDLSAAVFNGFLPAVARMRALDPVTSELVRLRGAAQQFAGCASRCGRSPRLMRAVRRRCMARSSVSIPRSCSTFAQKPP